MQVRASWWLALAAIASCGGPSKPVAPPPPPVAAPPPAKRVLRVALFPYLPDINHDHLAGLATTIERTFEAAHGDIDLVLKPFDPDSETFYDAATLTGWLDGEAGAEAYDVVELDTVLLGALAPHVAAWSSLTVNGDWAPAAASAVTIDDKILGYPHWLCGQFVITRDAKVGQAQDSVPLVAAIKKLKTKRKLVGDFAGSWNLPALYLDAWADSHGTAGGGPAIEQAMDKLDGKVVARLKAVEATCKLGATDRCTDGTYHKDAKIAADEFAAGEAGAFLGYSESLSEITDKRTDSAKLYLASAALGAGSHPLLFTDALVLRKGCDDACQHDARVFADFLTGPEMSDIVLLGKDGVSPHPRYLLPAQRAAFSLPGLANDPYYPVLAGLIATGAAFPTRGFPDKRGELKKQLTAALGVRSPGTK